MQNMVEYERFEARRLEIAVSLPLLAVTRVSKRIVGCVKVNAASLPAKQSFSYLRDWRTDSWAALTAAMRPRICLVACLWVL